MEELESIIFQENPNHVDFTIIGAMFFLNRWKNSPSTKDYEHDSRSGYQERGSKYKLHDPSKEDQVTD